jgi:DNA-binding NarL/FixJ family response regulator
MAERPDEPLLRVLVVADDPLVRTGLAAVLAASGCDIAGQTEANDDLVEQISVYRPDALLWDLGWDQDRSTSTPDAIADLLESSTPVVLLVPDSALAWMAWTAGCRCILLRDAPVANMHTALRGATQGLAILDPDLAASMVSSRAGVTTDLVEELTPREAEVLQLLADGLTNKGIGQKLGISEHTVKFHVNAILGKLQAESRTEAVVRASRLGLLLL